MNNTKKYQVLFLEYDDDKVPYTLEYFDSKQDAEKWAYDREFSYHDEVWNSALQDYKYEEIFRYHNPEDSQVYYGFEVKEINLNETKKMKTSEFQKLIREEVRSILKEKSLNEGIIKDEEYIAMMGPEFEQAVKVIEKAWYKWKNAPMTPPSMKKPAKQSLLDYFAMILD